MAYRTSMSVTQIQSFLNSKVPTCDTNGTQLSEYGGPDLNKDGKVQRWEWGKANYNQTTFTCLRNWKNSSGVSAAQVIYNKAQSYSINPQVLIVLLQKEQGLVTDTWPLNIQYRSATGYGCPDTAPCDSQYYGLENQLDWAAKMYRSILNQDPNWYSPYIKGTNPRVYWHPSGGNYVNSSGVDDSRAGCGYNSLTIKNWSTASLYSYTPYRPNQAALRAGFGTGDSCSSYGNRNFYSYFTDWFGSTTLPPAIKTSSSNTVYLQAGGYRFAVPAMAVLQDYGIAPGSIRTVSDSIMSSIPTPPSADGYSTSIGYLIKSNSDSDADGGSVYLVSLGKRSKIQSMQQISDFGLDTYAIMRLPLDYILSLDSAGSLSYFLGTPSNNVFQVATGKKRIIFNGSTYASLNPSGSITRLSNTTAALTASDKPISTVPILVRFSNGSIYLYQNNKYYPIPNMATYDCWGFVATHNTPLYRLASDEYATSSTTGSVSLNCAVKDTGGTSYILNETNKIRIPSNVPIQTKIIDQDLTNIIANQPSRSSDLSVFVKSNSSAAVWYLENGVRRPIPSYKNLQLLGYPSTPIDILEDTPLNSVPTGAVKLGSGLVVKPDNSSAIFGIVGDSRILYTNPELYIAYGNAWSDVVSQPASVLDTNYPYNGKSVDRFISTADPEVNYLVDGSGCKRLSSAQLSDYAKVRSELIQYTSSTFPSLKPSTCSSLSPYVKSPNSSAVYYVDSGTRHPFSSWKALQTHSTSSSPIISVISDTTLSQLPIGTTIK